MLKALLSSFETGRFKQKPSSEGNFSAPQAGPLHRLAGAPLQGRPRAILGISAFYHDSCAALIIDGRIIASVQEDRFSRRNHDPSFPSAAIAHCLKVGGLSLEQIDLVAFYEEPILKADRLARSMVAARETLDDALEQEGLQAVRRNLNLQAALQKELGYKGPLCFVQHHVSHAASTFYASGFDRAACLVTDGVGEWATTTLARCGPQGIELIEQIDYPHSLGLLYSAITAYLGFKINNDEYKVMALGPFAKTPRYEAELQQLLRLHPDHSFSVDLSFFDYHRDRKRAYNPRLCELFGLPARQREAPLTQAHYQVAHATQNRLEAAVSGLFNRLREKTSERNIVTSGGVALNSVANQKAFAQSGFESIFIQPAAGDAGGALGAALYAHHHLPEPKPPAVSQVPFDPYLGPAFTEAQIRSFLEEEDAEYEFIEDWEALYERVAQALFEGKVVGWYQGRMEIGPRALGARSILASPCDANMQAVVNKKIKFREGFRPFAPAILAERAHTLFSNPPVPPMDYMLFVAPVLEQARDKIPAVVHVDGTARPQRVHQARAPRFWSLISAFEKKSGVPALLNTSFNLAGEPIVCSPENAHQTFSYSRMDMLVMERFIVTKEAL